MVAKLHSPSINVIGQRLKLEMKKRNVNSPEIAKRAGVKASFLYDILSGKSSNPSTLMLARVADALGVSLTYLAGNSEIPEHLFPLQADNDQDYVFIKQLSVDHVHGRPAASQDPFDKRYSFSRAWLKQRMDAPPSELRLLPVHGDSMEPTLCHHDMLLVDIGKRIPSPPGLFVLFDGFGLTPKRLEYVGEKEPKQVRIISDNPQYSTYELALEEIFIVGRVVWFSREI